MNINLNVTVEEVNMVLGALAAQPYAQVHSLIEKISAAAQLQVQASQDKAQDKE
jgi:hypothetical protein